MKPIVIFGTSQFAELMYHYFLSDTDRSIVAFVVDREFATSGEFHGLPVAHFENVLLEYPPAEFDLFVAIGYKRLNQLRKDKYLKVRGLGYQCPNYISSRACVLTGNVVGDNCVIMEGATIQPYATIGSNTIVWSGALVAHHSHIGSHTFIGPRATIAGNVDVGECCFVGANATVRNGVRIGDNNVLGAGSLIMSDADPNGLYVQAPTSRAVSASKPGDA